MGRVAATVGELGNGRFDGEAATIRTSSGREEALFWNLTQSLWVGKLHISMRQLDTFGMSSDGNPTLPKYPAAVEIPHPLAAGEPTAFGFQIHETLNPSELWDAGLRPQELNCGAMFARDLTNPSEPSIGLNYYELADGDDFLSPDPQSFGVLLEGDRDPDVYKRFSSGWQNSPVSEPFTGGHWYPEIYTQGPPVNFRNFYDVYRWVGPEANIGSNGSFEESPQYPAISKVVGWYQAKHVPVALNASVPEIADYSGRSAHLQNSTTAEQPALKSDGTGQPRYIHHDGVNDFLTTPGLTFAQPYTVFILMRALASGGTTQVWTAPNGSGAPLFYRNGTNEVHLWANAGSDMIYTNSGWPTPWVVYSYLVNGSSTNVWENKTLKATGNAGSAGMAGFTVGAEHDGTDPARMDWIEAIVVADTVGDTAREAIIDQINARSGGVAY